MIVTNAMYAIGVLFEDSVTKLQQIEFSMRLLAQRHTSIIAAVIPFPEFRAE